MNPPEDWYLSDAHEVYGRTGDDLECARCGSRGDIERLFRDPLKRCTPHFVRQGSGWHSMAFREDG